MTRRIVIVAVCVASVGLGLLLVPHQPAKAKDVPELTHPKKPPPKKEVVLDPKVAPPVVTKGCATGGCHEEQVSASHLHPPTENDGCLACHMYKEVKEHSFELKRDGVELCSFCHIGASQGGLPEDHIHPPVVDGDCTACHDPHGADLPRMIREDSIRDLCLDCHDDLEDSDAPWHTRFEEGDCTACHVPHGSYREHLLAPNASVDCRACHADLLKVADAPAEPAPDGEQITRVHPPAAKGECTKCHQLAHDPAVPKLLRPGKSDCVQCHEKIATKAKSSAAVHTVVTEEGGCVKCHDAHVSPLGKLRKDHTAALCTQCHDEPVKRKDGTVVAAYGGEGEAPDKAPHGGPHGAACDRCHDPHGSPASHLLAEPRQRLCSSCHEEIAEGAQEATSSHSAAALGNCVNCHDPHMGEGGKLLRAEPEELCLTCHAKPVRRRDGSPLPAIGGEGAVVHDPVAEGACLDCHEVHSAEQPQLLSRSWTSERYVAFSEDAYETCFDCHDSELATEKETDEATGFRNGNENLHFLHVNQKKGRSCGACHDPHATRQQHLVKDALKFGTWAVRIAYQPTDDGGRCAKSCHGPAEYRRTKRFPNRSFKDVR